MFLVVLEGYWGWLRLKFYSTRVMTADTLVYSKDLLGETITNMHIDRAAIQYYFYREYKS